MLWAAMAYLPVVFAVLIMFAMAVVSVHVRLTDRRKASKEAAEFAAWMDTVDKTVGISELLKEK